MGKHKKQKALENKAKKVSKVTVPVNKDLTLEAQLEKLENLYLELYQAFDETNTKNIFTPSLRVKSINDDLVTRIAAICKETSLLINSRQLTHELYNRASLLFAKAATLLATAGYKFGNLAFDTGIVASYEKAVAQIRDNIKAIEYKSDESLQVAIFDAIRCLRQFYQDYKGKKRFTSKELEDCAIIFASKCGNNYIKVAEIYQYYCRLNDENEFNIFNLESSVKLSYRALLDESLGKNVRQRETITDSAELLFQYAALLMFHYQFHNHTHPRSIWLLKKSTKINIVETINETVFLKYFHVAKKFTTDYIVPAVAALTKIDLSDLKRSAVLLDQVLPLINPWITNIDEQITIYQLFLSRSDLSPNFTPALANQINLEMLELSRELLLLSEFRQNISELSPLLSLEVNRGSLAPHVTLPWIRQQKMSLKAAEIAVEQIQKIDAEKEKAGREQTDAKLFKNWASSNEKFIQSVQKRTSRKKNAGAVIAKETTKEIAEDQLDDVPNAEPLTIAEIHLVKIAELLKNHHLNEALQECEKLYELTKQSTNVLSQAQALDGKIFIYADIILPKITHFNKALSRKIGQDISHKECALLEISFKEFRRHCEDFSTLYTQYKQLIPLIASDQNTNLDDGIAFAITSLDTLQAQLEDLLKQAQVSITALRNWCRQERREFLLYLGYVQIEKLALLVPPSVEDVIAIGKEVFATFGKKDKSHDENEINYAERLKSMESLASGIDSLVETYSNLSQQIESAVSKKVEIDSYVNALLDVLNDINKMTITNTRPRLWEEAILKFTTLPVSLSEDERQRVHAVVRKHFVKADRLLYVKFLEHYGLLSKIFDISPQHDYLPVTLWLLEKKINLVNSYKEHRTQGLWMSSPVDTETFARIKPLLGNPFFKKDKEEKNAREKMVDGLDLPRVSKKLP